MKNPGQERLRRLMRQHHSHHPWRLEDRDFRDGAQLILHTAALQLFIALRMLINL